MPLHFEASGSGAIPLLCLHGWGCEGAQFSALADMLGGEFRIYRPDLPGHGKTPLHDFPPSFENYAECIVEFATTHHLEAPIVLGHSMGGVLALIAAASDGFEPRAIINLDGGLPPAPHTLAGQARIRAWLGEPDFRHRLADVLREGFFLPQERDARCEAIIRTMCAAPESVLRFLPEQIGHLEASDFLPKLTAPTLYIGAQAARFDAAGAEALISNLHIERFENTGHFLHLYALNRVAERIRAFVI